MQLFSFKKHLPIGLVLLTGLFLCTMGFDHYQRHPLHSIASEVLPNFSLTANRMTVVAKVMTPEESKRSFGHDLVSRGVKPLHLTIQNNTANQYSMCPGSVDLPRIEASKIAGKVTQSALPRSIGYKIASFFFWPFLIPSTIDGVRVMVHHQNLKKDILAKSMKEEVVAPYSTFNRVLFVEEKKFQESFKVTLIDLETLQPTEFQLSVN